MKSITMYRTWMEGNFWVIYSWARISLDYVRAVRIMLKFYLANARAKPFPIPELNKVDLMMSQ